MTLLIFLAAAAGARIVAAHLRARDYLLGRGLTQETLDEFRVGYAPSAWDRILRASRSAGFTEQELLDAGIVQRSQSRPGQIYDRFRERIMFPSMRVYGAFCVPLPVIRKSRLGNFARHLAYSARCFRCEEY